MKKMLLVVLAAGLLGACSKYSTTGENTYLSAKNGPSLVITPPLTDKYISHFYDLPMQTENAQVSIAPPDIKIDEEASDA